ncbi:MAG: response regulator [Anaerolineae bacterium]|nr:response regulator [Anaerolineae bacterium]
MAEESIRILLIEDNLGDARLLRELMAEVEGVHFQLIHVDRLSAGLTCLGEGDVDVVLLDLSLPDSQGPDTLTRLQSSAPDVPVVVLTGLEDETLGMALVQAGAQDYLVKGQVTDARLLLRSVRYAIERRQAEIKIIQYNQMLLTLQEAGAAIASSLDLPNVLDTLAREMTTFLGAEGCAIYEWREADETLSKVAEYGPAAWKQQRAIAKIHHSVKFSLTRRVLVEGQVQQMTIDQPELEPTELAYMQAAQLKTWLRLPLEFQGQPVGLVEIEDSRIERRFSGQEVALAQMLANQAASAIKNARLFTETERRAQHLAILRELDQALSASLRSEDVYHALTQHLARLLPYDYMSITLLEEQGLRVTHTFHQDETLLPVGMLLSLKTSAVGWVASKGQPLLRHHIAVDRHFAEDELLAAGGIKAGMSIPLRVKGHIKGVWNIGSRHIGIYGPDDVATAQFIANQLAIVIENAQLYEQARQEIAERKRIEARLKREHLFTAAILDTADALIVVLDAQGRIVHFNRVCEQLAGYTLAEVKGKHVWDLDLIPEEEAAPIRIVFEELRAGLFPNKYESFWITRDGQRRVIAWSNTARLNRVGVVKYVITVGTDITERKRLEEQLRQAQKMEALGRLASGLDHDFNNLLTVITGYSELLLQRPLIKDTPGHKYAEEIKKAGEQASAITRRLLAFSRQQVLQPELLNLNAVVANVRERLPQLLGQDIGVSTVLEPVLGVVQADPEQIEQIMLELILNAQEAMPQGGKLTIETANVELDEAYTQQHINVPRGPYVMLAVSDTGIGMSMEIQAHIFEPFFTTKKSQGLGLATVHGIVKQSGGHIWLYSEPGQGSTFKVYLPRTTETNAVLEASRTQREPLHGSETILLVEDKTDVRELIQTALVEHGYTVLEASNGREALVISERHPDLIHLLLTDLVMPEMSGRELTEYLTILRPEIKLLYMSGYTDETVVRYELLDYGAAFLQKPFTLETLAGKVRQVLDASKSPKQR